jgi:peptidoglycan glycosyltransferase
METQVRRVGWGLLVAFLAVFAQLNYVQIFAAESIASNPANIRSLLREYSIKRGDIVTIDGDTVAQSIATDDRLKFLRRYPEAELYGHITGYYSLVFGADRIERTYNDQLLGESGVISMQDIQDRFLGSGERGDDVRLTIDSRVQAAARDALGSNRGAVVALDPQTGAVRAMWSNPSFDPNPISSHRPGRIRQAWENLNEQTPNPLQHIAATRGFPPGSTFKVVTAAAALESGRFNPQSTFDDPVSFIPPQTSSSISNFSGGTCAGGGQISLADALRVSCNTTFAQLGLEVSGPMAGVTTGMGFNRRIPFDVSTEASTFERADENNLPRRSLAGIGQGDVVTTPLQMALVAAAIANGGETPKPRLVEEVSDPSGGIVARPSDESIGTAMSESTARTLTELMVAVVSAGTGANAQIPGLEIAGKTGTAQSAEGAAPHAWFIAFAPAQNPRIAVAVFVQNGGSFGAEATGGTVAAPMARQVIEADREVRRW